MSLAKVSIITLTLISLLVAPSLVELVGNDGSYTSSELTSWTNSNQDNFDAINGGLPNYSQDYDFRSFSPDLSQVANDFVETLNAIGTTANEIFNNVKNFFSNPFESIDPVSGIDQSKLTWLITNITNARNYWDTLTAEQQNYYTDVVYPNLGLSQFFYHSPAELNA
jgi:hypothetical protein